MTRDQLIDALLVALGEEHQGDIERVAQAMDDSMPMRSLSPEFLIRAGRQLVEMSVYEDVTCW